MTLPRLPLMLLQLGIIIAVGQGLAWAISHPRLGVLRQPTVMGPVLGGLALGPSLLGWLAPAAMEALFPGPSLAALKALAQAGLVLFMFIVGLELRGDVVRKQAGAAALISHASIVVPFAMGAGLALALFEGFAPAGVPFVSFALFMGIAMSITAFPVLASILKERRLMSTNLGQVAIASAAVDDVTGWAVLAVVIAVASSGSAAGALPAIALAAAYVAAMLGAARPLLRRWAGSLGPGGLSEPRQAAVPLLALLASAAATERIGIHALFGAFLAGAIMPASARLRERLCGPQDEPAAAGKRSWSFEDFVKTLLLPVFFALTGLRTEIGALSDPALWGAALAVMAVAVAGKLGAGALAARLAGMNARDALGIGALMNTRGLMELVVLNIGYDLGVISGPLFTMLVLMAVATTMMTGPLLSLIYRDGARPS